jgi:hypothetical protein
VSPTNSTADIFLHVRAVMGIILGLSIAQLLGGLARMVQHPGKIKIYPIHLGWVLSTFLFVIHFWWWEFRLSFLDHWTFERYLFIIFYASLFYFLCVLLLPETMEEYAGFREYFLSRRKWFFGILALIFAVDLIDTLSKGHVYFASLGAEYPIRAAAYVLLCVTAIFVRNEKFQGAFVVANLIYQVSWIFRFYDILT